MTSLAYSQLQAQCLAHIESQIARHGFCSARCKGEIINIAKRLGYKIVSKPSTLGAVRIYPADAVIAPILGPPHARRRVGLVVQ